MADLNTNGNELSVWLVHDDASNLQLIIAAQAANCEFVSNFDYALIPLAHLDSLSLTVKESPGKSPCPEGNQYHMDICQLTGRKQLEIGLAIFRHGKRERLREKEVYSLLSDALNAGWIDNSSLKKTLVKDLEKKGS